MGYGRLQPSATVNTAPSSPILSEEPPLPPPRNNKKKKIIILSLISLTLIVASAISATLLIGIKTRSTASVHRTPTQAISKTCSKTLYPSLCINSLLDFPGSLSASEHELVHISFNMTLQHFSKALYFSSEITNLRMDRNVRSAYDDCMELLDDSVDALSRSLDGVTSKSGSTGDIVTWLSASLTNHDTCTEGFSDITGEIKDHMSDKLKDLSEMVSNCLAIYSAIGGDDFAGIPVQNKRRLMNDGNEKGGDNPGDFPVWVGQKERRLLGLPVTAVQADIVVSKDGNGTCKTIAEAIKKVPEYSSRRIIIYVKAGRYEENNLKVGRKKRNLMFMGDGMGKTVISGGNSVSDSMTTFHTASFAATGTGFIARDITFENWAGPSKHQAVALRVGADHAVVYRCSIIGYQDTLYVHSNRQFFRECNIYGTVDFIFGNAAVVFQHCNIYARKPMPLQKNTITAQNRKDPNQNTGISIHACQILATSDLESSKGSFPTYLGRPWKLYSRTVYMLSNMGDHIHPKGWLEWNGAFALDTLYYGEYTNNGPGSGVAQRVKWPGYHVITSSLEAGKFTVGQFIYGSSWLPSTGVAYLAGLSG